jgi:hypothetical protein
MPPTDEHDDDLEPEVEDDAAIETERYGEVDDDEEIMPEADVTNQSDGQPRDDAETGREEESEDEASDSI